MKKIIIITIAVIMFLINSCGDKYENVVIDIRAVSDDILTKIIFDDQLVLLNEDNMKLTYNFGEYVDMVVYAGSGATAEEIIIVECTDSAAADKMYINLDIYYKNKKFYFKGYNPDETYKLDEPVFIRLGKYVIYCVSPNTDSVRKIVDSNIKETV